MASSLVFLLPRNATNILNKSCFSKPVFNYFVFCATDLRVAYIFR